MGRRPELKSAELCDANVTVIEITSIFCLKPLKQVVQLLAARPKRWDLELTFKSSRRYTLQARSAAMSGGAGVACNAATEVRRRGGGASMLAERRLVGVERKL